MSELAALELSQIEVTEEPRKKSFVPQTRAAHMTIALEGEIGIREYDDIADQLFRFSSRGVRRVVIDFCDVSHVDYRVVRPLMLRASGLRHLGGDVKLCGMSPYIHAIFRSAGANDAFDYYAEAIDAVASFDRAVLTAG
jgi:anti-sigma B factor antagonist